MTRPETSYGMQRLMLLNLVVMAFQPLIVLILLFSSGPVSIREFPVWGRGIVFTWAFSLALWSMFVDVRSERPPKLRQAGFLASAFVAPIAGALIFGDGLAVTIYDIATYHTLAVSCAFGVVLLLGPFVYVEMEELRFRTVERRSWRAVGKALPFGGSIGGALGSLALTTVLFMLIAAPGVAAEVAFVQHVDRAPYYWIARYLAVAPEIVVIYGYLVRHSIYGVSYEEHEAVAPSP
ncbi:MAG: hypothetical protein KF901_11345 [Myxococcales bacterium]|nr:hypothetical protein [Myxococcales bacterium]